MQSQISNRLRQTHSNLEVKHRNCSIKIGEKQTCHNVVAPMTFMMTQQRTRTICSPKLIAIFKRLKKFKEPIRLQGCENLSFHWIGETVQVEVITVRPNFHVKISEQFTIRECMRPSFEGSVNMDLKENVDKDDYLRNKVSCSKTRKKA